MRPDVYDRRSPDRPAVRDGCHRVSETTSRASALFPTASAACPSSRPTCGGSGTDGARGVPRARLPAVARHGAQPGADAAPDAAGAARAGGADPVFLRLYDAAIKALDRARSGEGTWWTQRNGAGPTRGRSPTSPPSSPCTSRCRSTPAASACWPATTARKPATSACRSSASASCIRRATSTRASRPRAGRKSAIDARLGGRADRAGAHARRQAVHHRRAARQAHGARLGVARQARATRSCTCSTPISRRTRRGIASCRRASTAAIARRASSRRSSSASAACARCARSASTRRCGTSTRATPPSSCCSASASSSSRAYSFDDALATSAAHGLHDAHAGAGRPRRVPVPPWSRRTSPAAGAASAITARTSSRSAATTTASGTLFNMTALALRVGELVNAVSQLHGEVTREMWAPLCRQAGRRGAGRRHHQRRAPADLARRRHRPRSSTATSTRTGAIATTIRRSGSASSTSPTTSCGSCASELRGYLITFIRERVRERWMRERVQRRRASSPAARCSSRTC